MFQLYDVVISKTGKVFRKPGCSFHALVVIQLVPFIFVDIQGNELWYESVLDITDLEYKQKVDKYRINRINKKHFPEDYDPNLGINPDPFASNFFS